jgi:dihydroorotase
MSLPFSDSLVITRPDDWHLHLRDGVALAAVVADSARQFARAIVMPNLKSPVTTTAQALAYRQRIEDALARIGMPAETFTPLMTLYLTAATTATEIQRAQASGKVYAVKLYPAGATTHSEAGVSDVLKQCRPVLEALERGGMPLLVHGEVTDPAVDVFDREAVFIERVMVPLRQAYPALKVVFEHITTQHAAEYVRDAAGPIAATITPQHLRYNRNALFQGGMRPHRFCLPLLKRENHRQALIRVATSGNPRFFLGTDSAPHARYKKEHACGCAGCYTALHAMALYAQVFEEAGALEKLEGFASHYGADFYGLPRNQQTLTLVRAPYVVPCAVPYGRSTLVPLAAGESLSWRL